MHIVRLSVLRLVWLPQVCSLVRCSSQHGLHAFRLQRVFTSNTPHCRPLRKLPDANRLPLEPVCRQ